MAIKTSSAKAKGRKLQQWTRDTILTNFPTLNEDDVRSTAMGSNGEDIQFSQAARDALGVVIECKARASIAAYEWYEQATGHGNHEPVLVMKADRKKPLAVVDAEWLFRLMKGRS